MGGEYKALYINAKRAINIGTRLALKIHKRGEGAVKLERHGFFPKVGTEEHIMEFLKRYVGWKK